MKSCLICKLEKPFSEYWKSKNSRDDYHGYCKRCLNQKRKKYNDKYIKTDKGKISRSRAGKKYYLKTRERRLFLRRLRYPKDLQRLKNKLATDPVAKIKFYIRIRTAKVLKIKKFKKTTPFSSAMGCSAAELKTYIESLFKPGMTWQNRGYAGWHLDHIIPLSAATTERQLYDLCHYTNLQPLWAADNFRKGNKQ